MKKVDHVHDDNEADDDGDDDDDDLNLAKHWVGQLHQLHDLLYESDIICKHNIHQNYDDWNNHDDDVESVDVSLTSRKLSWTDKLLEEVLSIPGEIYFFDFVDEYGGDYYDIVL